ncbi:L,D-transpeptidase family protein [[Clostridium] aminophilum]|uniref:L,D-transpeptidase family protein n=1 Tax=[Clostridium] aminophilum TaxID=1526 RepID=UPI003329920B
MSKKDKMNTSENHPKRGRSRSKYANKNERIEAWAKEPKEIRAEEPAENRTEEPEENRAEEPEENRAEDRKKSPAEEPKEIPAEKKKENPRALAEESDRPENEAAETSDEHNEPEKMNAFGADAFPEEPTESSAAEEPKKRGRSRAEKNNRDLTAEGAVPGKKKAMIAAAAAAAVLLCGAGGYAVKAQTYRNVFFPQTIINGVDASGKTPQEVEQEIEHDTRNYTLTIAEREGKSESIAGQSVDMKPEFDGSIEKLLDGQNIWKWGLNLGKQKKFTIDTAVTFDEKKLEKLVDDLECLDRKTQTRPENASVSEYADGKGYSLVPAKKGTLADSDKLHEAVRDAMKNLQTELDLEKEDLYLHPTIDDDNETLLSTLDHLNKAAEMSVIYRFGDEKEVLNGDTIRTWLSVGEDGSMKVNEGEAAAYVSTLAQKYDTVGRTRGFRTSYGTTVDVKGGTYGWKIDTATETANLLAAVREGESAEKEPAYAKSGKSRANGGIGDTYVEVNLTGQHLYYYKNGTLVLDTDFVSGNLSKGHGTPNGVYTVAYKQKNAVLKGENYRTPVSYWMPFNNGIGFHDANWRGSFGGTIYKTNGSHGCINMPPSMAKKLFENIDTGCIVVCYGAAGTESKKTSRDGRPSGTEAAAETSAQASESAPTAQAGQTAENKQKTEPANTQVGPGGASTPTSAAAQPETSAAKPAGTAVANPAETQADGPRAGQPAQTKTEAARQETAAVSGPGSDRNIGAAVGPGAA